MSQFTLNWNNSSLVGSSNSLTQRAVYRFKMIGGVFVSDNFTPPNDLDLLANTVDSPILPNNVIIEFKIQTICTVSGPTDNDNGIQEVIEFAEIIPTIVHSYNDSSIGIDVTGTDITQARFTLRRSSNNTIVGTSIVANVIANSITANIGSLVYSTNYYWEVELYTTINYMVVISSSSNYVGSPYSPYPFTTDTPPLCDPVTAITVTSVEVP